MAAHLRGLKVATGRRFPIVRPVRIAASRTSRLPDIRQTEGPIPTDRPVHIEGARTGGIVYIVIISYLESACIAAPRT